VELYTAPPAGSTVICADELGPVIPRTFAPAPGWSPGGHRIKAPLEYSRGPEKTWVYGGLRVADGQAVTMCASSRNSAFYQDFLQLEEQANPDGTLYVITDNLSSHDSKSTRAWLEDHPRIRHAFIPKGACWLNLQEGWWRIFRKTALAGQSFADPDEIAHATQVATAQLNARARPWIWGRPQPKPRSYRRRSKEGSTNADWYCPDAVQPRLWEPSRCPTCEPYSVAFPCCELYLLKSIAHRSLTYQSEILNIRLSRFDHYL